MANFKIVPMAKRETSSNVPQLPTFTSRDKARAFASHMRERGVTPTTPEKLAGRWHVGIKHTHRISLNK